MAADLVGDELEREMSVAPSGWYQDPYGEAPFRFWDGNIWTSATSPGARAAQSMAVQPLVAAPTRSAAVPTTDRDKGAALEQKVATLLRSMGYDVKTNVIITGRSGARHELDVVGEKSDQLTTFRVAVECKAWEQPIEEDVVAKFSYVLGDIGMREGIVACLGGYRSGAEVAARELGVQLWGPDELQSRLGAVAMSDMSTRAPQRVASGLPSGMTLAQAGPLFEREAKGKLGFGGEEIVWRSSAWLPTAVVQVALSTVEGRLKKVLQVHRIWNAYEMLDGSLVGKFSTSPPLSDVDLAKSSIRPMRKESSATKAVKEAVDNYGRVSTEAARERHAIRLKDLGIPAPYRAVAENVTLAFLPLHLALLRRRDGERVVAVDALNRIVNSRLSVTLSSNIHLLRESFQ